MNPKSLKLRVKNLGVSTKGLHVLRAALGLEGNQPEANRPILLAIDFENTKNFMNGFPHSETGQVGLATLDTRELHTSPPEKLISTNNLISGSSSYTSMVSSNVLFGTTAIIKPAEVLQKIQSLIPSDRDIILVGHGVRVELGILVALGFTFSPRIASIIDTCGVTGEVLGSPHYSLRELLKTLGCPHDRLHTAGNDAHFTLRAALLLVARGFPDHDHPTIDILRSIAMEPLAHQVRAEARAATREERKIAHLNSRKYQSQFWTDEQKDELRAQRAAKKAQAEVDIWNLS
uniref:Gfd2/YDR514C-like C-terminal domain-containing protein n=1 Tax=Bionectria ochroleuca TaxID=29856 RepID=A0A8H7TVB9_BIOOC